MKITKLFILCTPVILWKGAFNMSNKKPKVNKVLLPIGSSSLIMVFIVLCMAIFAAITFLTASNEKKLTNQSAEFLEKYYMANEQAGNILSDIQKAIDETGETKNLSINTDVSITYVENGLEFDVPVTEALVIKVKANIDNDKKLVLESYSMFNLNSMNVIEDGYLNLFEGDESIEGFADDFENGG